MQPHLSRLYKKSERKKDCSFTEIQIYCKYRKEMLKKNYSLFLLYLFSCSAVQLPHFLH